MSETPETGKKPRAEWHVTTAERMYDVRNIKKLVESLRTREEAAGMLRDALIEAFPAKAQPGRH